MESLTKPIPTFKKEKKNANLVEGAMHVAVAGVITGFLSGLFALIFGSAIASTFFPMASGVIGVAAFLAALILTPIVSVIAWLISSGIYYIVAMLLGGKGNYVTQSYLIAIYSAPLSVISVVLSLIPIVGPFIAIIPGLYALYLLTMSLKEAHGFTTGRAVLVWLLPVIVLALIAFMLGLAFSALAYVFLYNANIGSMLPGRV
jgi:hypothetical protein